MAAISAARGAPTALTPPSSSHGDEPSWRYRNQHEVSLRRQPRLLFVHRHMPIYCAIATPASHGLMGSFGMLDEHGLTSLLSFRRSMTKMELDISATIRIAILARTETSIRAMTPRHGRCTRRILFRTTSGMHMPRLASSRPFNSTTSGRIGRLPSLRRMR